MKNLFAIVAVLLASVSGAAAATFPTFQFDASNSSIVLTQTGGDCLYGDCSLTVSFASDAMSLAPWTPTAADDALRIDNFIDWSLLGSGYGYGTYDVVATLAFSAPDPASAMSSGFAGTVSLGTFKAGMLLWDGPGTVNFAQGSSIDFYLDDLLAGGFGNTVTTGVTFVGNDIAPVPLPATGLLLLGGLGAIALMRRRKLAA